MTSWWDDDDDALLAELGSAVREARAVPASFVAVGKAAYAWRTIDAELAQLRSDTTLDTAGLRGETSGAGQARVLTFAAGALAIEIEIRSDAVRGQLLPAQAGTVRVRDGADAVTDIPADDVGWFVIRPVPTGPFRLHVRTASGDAVLTGWIDAAAPTG